MTKQDLLNLLKLERIIKSDQGKENLTDYILIKGEKEIVDMKKFQKILQMSKEDKFRPYMEDFKLRKRGKFKFT